MDVERHYLIALCLRGKRCIVVGGGPVAARKVQGVVEAGAKVTVVAPVMGERVRRIAEEGDIDLVERSFEPGDLDGADLVFAATDNERLNAEVGVEAADRCALFNDATSAEGSDFLVPSVLRRGSLSVGITTGGSSPAYAKLIRGKLEDILGPEHSEMVNMLEMLRPRVMERFPDDSDRRRSVWDTIVSWETLELIRCGETEQVEARIKQCLSSS